MGVLFGAGAGAGGAQVTVVELDHRTPLLSSTKPAVVAEEAGGHGGCRRFHRGAMLVAASAFAMFVPFSLLALLVIGLHGQPLLTTTTASNSSSSSISLPWFTPHDDTSATPAAAAQALATGLSSSLLGMAGGILRLGEAAAAAAAGGAGGLKRSEPVGVEQQQQQDEERIRMNVGGKKKEEEEEGRKGRMLVRFFSIGDWGRNGSFNQSMLADEMGVLAGSIKPQMVISTGDNFYRQGLPSTHCSQFASSFSDIYTAEGLQVPWYSAMGNHDYYGNALAVLSPALRLRDWRWQCSRSRRLLLPLCGGGEGERGSSSGSMCRHHLEVFIYDSTPLVAEYRTKANEKMDWRGLNSSDWDAQRRLQLHELESWLQASTATWKVVIGHHPVYSFGKHGHTWEMVEYIKPLLEKYGVHVYMSGHEHNLQHIKPWGSSVHYIVNGGGSKAYGTMEPVRRSLSLQYFWPGQGFVSTEANEKVLEMKFYGIYGDVLHTVSLKKQRSWPLPLGLFELGCGVVGFALIVCLFFLPYFLFN